MSDKFTAEQIILLRRRVWAVALRSNRFIQCKRSLKERTAFSENGDWSSMHCGLGVGCEIFLEENNKNRELFRWDAPDHEANDIPLVSLLKNEKVGMKSGTRFYGSMPTVICEYFGLTGSQHLKLVEANDVDEKDFWEISQMIESLPIIVPEDWNE